MLEIISYIASGIMTVIGPLLFTKIIIRKNIRITRLKSFLLIIISATLIILAQLYITGIIKTIVHCLIFIIITKENYKLDLWKTILLISIYVILLMIIDGLAIYTSIYILNIDKSIFYDSYAGAVISNAITLILILIFAKFLKEIIRKLLNYKLDTNKSLILLLVIVSICIFYTFFVAFSNINITKDFYINIIIIIVFLIVMFSLIYQLIINSRINLEYDKLLEFMKTYEKEIENQRIARHETKNQLLTIKSKIYDKEKDSKVINYINSILDEKIEVSQEHYAKFQYLPANGLKALFYFKTCEAEDKNIKVSINISKRVEDSLLYTLTTNEFKQLGRLIGVYLDNAIEASSISKDKLMGIEIYVISGNVEIIISNSYIADNEKISVNGKSTKGKNRGHGLLLAKSILNSTNKFQSNKTITDKLYIQKLIIKKSIHNE